MKILFVQQDTCMYGASRSLLALIEQLIIRGHSCFVLLPRNGPLVTELEVRRVPYELIPWRGWVAIEQFSRARRFLSGLKGLILNLKHMHSAARICRRFRPDVIHTNSSKTAFGSMLALMLRVPHTWHFREFLGGKFSNGLVLSFGSRISKAWLRRTSSTVIFISDTLRQHFVSQLNGLDSEVLYNGVMSGYDIQESRVFPPLEPLTLALIGRLESLKQPLVAIKAIEQLRNQGVNVRLVIAGGGQQEDVEAVADYIKGHRLGTCVKLLGMVKDTGKVYTESHALVICSKGEAFGRVTAEAMAYSRLVIGANAGATPELIEHGSDGLLFRAGDPHDLANKIRYLFDHKDLISYMGFNAAKKAKREFTTEKYAESIERIFFGCCAST